MFIVIPSEAKSRLYVLLNSMIADSFRVFLVSGVFLSHFESMN